MNKHNKKINDNDRLNTERVFKLGKSNSSSKSKAGTVQQRARNPRAPS
jgi:hypothetical protein